MDAYTDRWRQLTQGQTRHFHAMTRRYKLFLAALAALILILASWMLVRDKFESYTLESTVKFKELPPIVADMFRNKKKYEELGLNGSLMSADSVNTYRLEVEKTGPWTDYYVIIRNDRERFRIPYGKAFPLIIHDNKLFIPDRYNVANSDIAEIATYERYRLEN